MEVVKDAQTSDNVWSTASRQDACNSFKLYTLDVGLLGAMTDAPAASILIGDNIFSEYKGAFTENYVLQQIATINNRPTYYYSKDNSSQELDFVVQKDTTIYQISPTISRTTAFMASASP